MGRRNENLEMKKKKGMRNGNAKIREKRRREREGGVRTRR